MKKKIKFTQSKYYSVFFCVCFFRRVRTIISKAKIERESGVNRTGIKRNSNVNRTFDSHSILNSHTSKVSFPPCLTFLASVFGTFLPYFSDPAFPRVLRRIYKSLLNKKKFASTGKRTRDLSHAKRVSYL